MESLIAPGAKQASQTWTRLRSFGTASFSADGVSNTRGRPRRSARLLWAAAPGTATKINRSGKKLSTCGTSGVMSNILWHTGLTKRPHLLLKGVLLHVLPCCSDAM